MPSSVTCNHPLPLLRGSTERSGGRVCVLSGKTERGGGRDVGGRGNADIIADAISLLFF